MQPILCRAWGRCERDGAEPLSYSDMAWSTVDTLLGRVGLVQEYISQKIYPAGAAGGLAELLPSMPEAVGPTMYLINPTW